MLNTCTHAFTADFCEGNGYHFSVWAPILEIYLYSVFVLKMGWVQEQLSLMITWHIICGAIHHSVLWGNIIIILYYIICKVFELFLGIIFSHLRKQGPDNSQKLTCSPSRWQDFVWSGFRTASVEVVRTKRFEKYWTESHCFLAGGLNVMWI